jgi:aerobic-type carbon monoxide dehydrogenase small subunit (CoxS/CutS family)
MNAKKMLTLRVNGAERTLAAEPNAILLDVLREQLDLTGTKRGCDMGTCGCCTVMIDGEARLACLTLAASAAGHEVTTVEGVTPKDGMSPLQKAFCEVGGSQCGFCTPGFIMTATALLDHVPDPTEHEIREAISGNMCRCTGYVKIVEAIQRAGQEMRVERVPADPREKEVLS